MQIKSVEHQTPVKQCTPNAYLAAGATALGVRRQLTDHCNIDFLECQIARQFPVSCWPERILHEAAWKYEWNVRRTKIRRQGTRSEFNLPLSRLTYGILDVPLADRGASPVGVAMALKH